MGPTQAVYLSTVLDDVLLRGLDALLVTNCDELMPTRKGRVWSARIGGRPFEISVERTADVRWDCEEGLVAHGLSIEGTPTRVVVAAGCNPPADWDLLDKCVRHLLRGLPESFTVSPAAK